MCLNVLGDSIYVLSQGRGREGASSTHRWRSVWMKRLNSIHIKASPKAYLYKLT